MLAKSNPEQAKQLLELAQDDVAMRWKLYEHMSHQPANGAPGGEEMIDLTKTIDLSTTYLGLNLKNPLVASSSPMCEDVANVRRLEDAGAAAVVLQSLFEEQIELESDELDRFMTEGSELSPEAMTHFPELTNRVMGPEAYLTHIVKCKQAVKIPDHRQPERHDQGRLAGLCQADGAGRRGRAGAEHLLHLPVDPNGHRRSRWSSGISTW